MDEEKLKLKKLQEEQKANSKKKELLNSYIESSKNFDDKVVAVKLRHRVDKTSFISVRDFNSQNFLKNFSATDGGKIIPALFCRDVPFLLLFDTYFSHAFANH